MIAIYKLQDNGFTPECDPMEKKGGNPRFCIGPKTSIKIR